MRIASLCGVALLLAACAPSAPTSRTSELSPSDLQSGYAFLTPETQQLQDDPFENPGYLWVDRGERLFQTSAAAATPSCASCHTEGLSGAASSYPAIEPSSKRLINLEGRINQCRTEHQELEPLAYESEDLLGLTAFVANQSRGQPYGIAPSRELQPYIEAGRTYFETRRGMMNLSCQQCHSETWGKALRGDTISQGHANAFPAYRFEWQSLGSLHRRFRDCDTGVRAEPLPYGDETYVALELYLATRGAGLEIETPGVRR